MSSLTHVSKILWHFYSEDPQKGIKIICDYLHGDTITLKPYYGNPEGEKYSSTLVQQETFGADSFGPNEMPSPQKNYYVKEKKAVCFCDIPINHLPLHMEKYGYVGIGLERDFLISRSQDFQPVRYYFIKKIEEYDSDVNSVFQSTKDKDSTTVTLEPYIKVPTLLGVNGFSQRRKNKDNTSVVENFNSIYEEREWRLFDDVKIEIKNIAFLLLPSKDLAHEKANELKPFFENKVGIIYTNEIFQKD